MEGSHQTGFTLPELLLVLSLMAGLLAWGTPTLREAAANAARNGAVNTFMQSVHLARSEAIKRNGVVSLCPSRDGSACSGDSDWRDGWLVFVNLDHDSPAVRDAGEPLVRTYGPWPSGHVHPNRTTLSFRAFGQSGVNATAAFCDARGSASARAVIISQTGRPRVSQRDASGGPIPCP